MMRNADVQRITFDAGENHERPLISLSFCVLLPDATYRGNPSKKKPADIVS
jgi:hypothetical protein